MDDIEVWLRTDLVRLDIYICCVGCGKAGVLGGEAWDWGSSTMVGRRRGRGQLTELTFLSHMRSGDAGSGHSLLATQLRTDVGRPLTSVDTRAPSSYHS